MWTFCNTGALRKIFTSFASFAVRVPIDDLDGAKFSKLCRDAKLLGKQFNAIDVDIVFAKVKVSQHLWYIIPPMVHKTLLLSPDAAAE